MKDNNLKTTSYTSPETTMITIPIEGNVCNSQTSTEGYEIIPEEW